MGLEWFEYYAMTNDVKNLKADIRALKKSIKDLKKEIEKLKKKKQDGYLSRSRSVKE